MVVFILERVPTSLRGELTKWLLEVHTNVFVGTVTALVRDKLWAWVVENKALGNCALTHSMNNEQGFVVVTNGPMKKVVRDFDGLQLMQTVRHQKGGKPVKTG